MKTVSVFEAVKIEVMMVAGVINYEFFREMAKGRFVEDMVRGGTNVYLRLGAAGTPSGTV